MAAGDGCALAVRVFHPRAVAAWQWDVLWGDTLHYYASQSLERGDFERGFAEFGLNIYPLILIPLRHLGIDWQIAGKWFSVLVATLAVVPMWGWLRRMFDDRTALLACLVYALHGKLIAISPLIIRDSTFWLLVATTLYCLWRARASCGWRISGGGRVTLAVHTRTEGWLLVVPLVGWTAWQPRWSSGFHRRNHRLKSELQHPVAQGRATPWARHVAGVLLCLAVIPVSLTAVNATWLRDHPRWDMLRIVHWNAALDWLMPGRGLLTLPPDPDALAPRNSPPATMTGGQRDSPIFASTKIGTVPCNPAAPPSILLPETLPSEKKASPWLLLFKLFERLAKALTWVVSVLLLLGIACHLRKFLWAEHLTLLVMNVLLLAVSGIRYRSLGLDLHISCRW